MASMTRHDRESAMTQDAFRARMEAQCYQIERYRHAQIRGEGRVLSQDEAALEWIELYAEAFARGEYIA